MICRPTDLVHVRRVHNRGRGARGVFASADIEPGTVIERVPVILIPEAQVFGDAPVAKRSARISWYVFGWEKVTKRNYVALALGYGSLYNHSADPNARADREAPDILNFTAVRQIAQGEEITIQYAEDAVGFEVH